MEFTFYHLTPSPEQLEAMRTWLVKYWNAAAFSDHLAGVPGNLVRETEIKITELLQDGSPEAIYLACRLTVKFQYEVKQQ